MSPHTKTLLDENKIYVSWALMVSILATSIFFSWNVAQTLAKINSQLEQLPTMTSNIQKITDKVQVLEFNYAFINKDIAELKRKLDPYEVEYKK